MGSNGNKFERQVVEVVSRMLDERGKTQTDFANSVWPEKSKPDNIWQTVKGETGKKPRDIRVSELYNIACYFGYDVEDFVGKIHREMKKKSPRTDRLIENGTYS